MAMIHALPGMGGDHRMYRGAWNTLLDKAELIIDGGHLIAMTHAQKCVDSILNEGVKSV